MKIRSADFVMSNTALDKCPEPNKPEFAFIGRSNVGKSSVINMLTDHKGLAKISGRPGKTQTINHFIINDARYLVDLPGYGYAKTSKSDRRKFAGFIQKYLVGRTNLLAVFVLLDIRHEPQPIDLEFMGWLGEKQVPFVMVFTKADKLKEHEIPRNLLRYKEEMLKEWEYLPDMFITSSVKKAGREDLLAYLDEVMPVWEAHQKQQNWR